jgi:hypothetical protein
VLRPQLPPGARLHRLVAGAHRFWLATDRGLLESAALTGPWRRVAWAAGTADIAAVVAGADAVIAAAREGVWVGSAGSPSAGSTFTKAGSVSAATAGNRAAPPGIESTEPSIAQVHRAAIRYLGLERSRMEGLRRGAQRRGWWPILTVRGAGAWDHFRSVDDDQAFLSGETRFLTDRDSGSGDDYDVSLTLSWDLRALAYEPESIDVSRETREVIELRDDVLDEITQLYFERRAVLATLQVAAGSTAPEMRSLRLRADELAAAIDAWTGGWFSSRVAALAP